MNQIAIAAISVVLAATPASAQVGGDAVTTARSADRLLGGGLVGGLAGAGLGWASAALLTEAEEGLLFGALGGASMGVPIGVHIANGGRGRLGASTAASLAIGLVGGLVFLATYSDAAAVGVSVAVPIAQMVVTSIIEMATTPQPGP